MVEWDGLENRCSRFGYRGFESHPLRSLHSLRGQALSLIITRCEGKPSPWFLLAARASSLPGSYSLRGQALSLILARCEGKPSP